MTVITEREHKRDQKRQRKKENPHYHECANHKCNHMISDQEDHFRLDGLHYCSKDHAAEKMYYLQTELKKKTDKLKELKNQGICQYKENECQNPSTHKYINKQPEKDIEMPICEEHAEKMDNKAAHTEVKNTE